MGMPHLAINASQFTKKKTKFCKIPWSYKKNYNRHIDHVRYFEYATDSEVRHYTINIAINFIENGCIEKYYYRTVIEQFL